MSGLWQFVIPADCTNLFTNPSAETATTGFTANGGSIARTVGAGRKGAYGVVHTPSSSTSSGIYRELSLTNATAYIFSVYVKAAVGIPCQIYFANASGTPLGTPTTFTGDGGWHRYSVSYVAASTATHRLYLAKNGSSSTANIQSDGWMLHTGTELQTYVDGDQLGCVWTSTPHASTSYRLATSRAGGIIRNLDDYAIYVETVTGYGEPPYQVNTTEYGSLPGALYDSTRARPRSLQLALKGLGTSLSNLHNRRDALIAALNPDATPLQEPFQCRYLGLGDGKERLLRAVLDDGLGGTPPDGFAEAIPLRLLATDPFWYADGEAAESLGQGTFTANYLAQRAADGTWTGLAGGANNAVYTVAYDEIRKVYWFGGLFTTIGGVSASRIAKYDVATATFSALSTGTNGTVQSIAVDPVDGSIILAGAFTLAGGVANTSRIAKWNGSVFTALGTGGSGGDVQKVAFDTAHNVYAVGAFTSMGGVANTSKVAKWNGSAWSALGTGMNNTCFALTIGPDGNPYFGGDFSTANGVTVNKSCYWDGTTFVALSSGSTNGLVYGMAFAPDGGLYVVGEFTTIGGVSCSRAAVWNGTAFGPLGNGLGTPLATAKACAVDPLTNVLYVVGAFTTAGGLTLPDSIAAWNGTVWQPLDVSFGVAGAATLLDIQVNSLGVLTVGWNFAPGGTAKIGSVATVTNDGTAAAYPRLIITGPSSGSCLVNTLVNNTITASISFNNLTIQAGEVITLDLTPGKRSFTSTVQGNIIGKIQPGSNLGTWRLHPGANKVTFLANDNSVTAVLVWPLRYRSADGGA
jgi:hypothetical protein